MYHQTNTLSDFLYLMPSPELREDLEQYRRVWERVNNTKVDLSKYYTSMWPEKAQAWLLEHDPERYWDGLPPFVRGFIRKTVTKSIQVGTSVGRAFLGLHYSGYLYRSAKDDGDVPYGVQNGSHLGIE